MRPTKTRSSLPPTPPTGEAGDPMPARGAATSGQPPQSSFVRRAAYRVFQMWRSLVARPLDARERAILTELLPPDGQALFATMTRNDQRHSFTVYRALLAQGCEDHELLAAALLHDSGKGGGRVPLWVRPPVVLLRTFAPGLLRWLARPEPAPTWYRRPFYNAWYHAGIGADLAAAAGLSERAVLLIRTHHIPDGPAAALHAVDDAV